MSTIVREFAQAIQDDSKLSPNWNLKIIMNEDNLTYLAFNHSSREAILVDPMREDWDVLIQESAKLHDYRFLAIIDTHTHADHVSCAARLANHLGVPLVMHQLSPSKKIHLRVNLDTAIPSIAGPVRFLTTPGHTPDSLTVIWGPFLFTGDTILYGDTGRDDLPGGDPVAHYESLQKIKSAVKPDSLFLTGHDGAGRISSWQTQLKVNPSLSQPREAFIAEAGSYVGPSPKNLKESLFENFK